MKAERHRPPQTATKWWELVCYEKTWDGGFVSWFGGIIHHGEAETRGSWSHGVHQEADRDERCCSAYFSFFIQSGTLGHGNALLTLRVVFPHRHAQKFL